MKSFTSLSWKELLQQKVMTILIIIAIIFSTMMTTVVGQSIGILNSMRSEQAANLNGDRYATFHQLTEEQTADISNDPRISFAGKMIALGRADITNTNISILLREYWGDSLSAYESTSQLEKGRLPKEAGEIALPNDMLSALGFEGAIGDKVSLDINISLLRDPDVGYKYSSDFIVTGILKPNYTGYLTGTTSGIVGKGTAEKVLPEKYLLNSVDIRTVDKKKFQETMDDFIQTLSIPEENLQYNDTMLATLGIDYRSDKENDSVSAFSFMTLAAILIGSLVLLAAGLVIYNILKISVTKRMKEFGILRAIGAERRQLYLIVALQVSILCCIGISIGAILGSNFSKTITTMATSLLNPATLMASSQSEVTQLIADNATNHLLPLVISIMITLLFTFVAAMPAARYAGKVSPTTAMAGRTIIVKRRNRKVRKIRNFEAFYARMNMKRNKGRSIITILSLVMSITVFVSLQSFSILLDVSTSVQKLRLGDYSITNENTGISAKEIKDIKSLDGIIELSTLKFKLYMSTDEDEFKDLELSFELQPGETLQITALDEKSLKSILPTISSDDMEALKTGKGALVKNPIVLSYGEQTFENTAFKIGDKITVNGKELEIIGVLDDPVTLDNAGFINGVQLITYDTVYDEITGENHYTEIYPTLAEGADREEIEQFIQAMSEKAGAKWFSYEKTDIQLKESYTQIRLLAWGLILFVGAIGLLNIINTVYTNIHTRISEIGVQRAIGMSTMSLYKTFLWESAYYGIIASVIGGGLGYICTVLINAATSDMIQLVSIPFVSIAQATICSISACLIATIVPLIKISKMDIVDSIDMID